MIVTLLQQLHTMCNLKVVVSPTVPQWHGQCTNGVSNTNQGVNRMKKTRTGKLVLKAEVLRSVVTELQRGRMQEVRGGGTNSYPCSDDNRCRTIDLTFH